MWKSASATREETASDESVGRATRGKRDLRALRIFSKKSTRGCARDTKKCDGQARIAGNAD